MGKKGQKGKKGGGSGKHKKNSAGKSKKATKRSSASAGQGTVKGGAPTGPRGLVNIGNTCFFNAVLQNLFQLKSVREHFLSSDALSAGRLSSALKECVEAACGGGASHSAVNPGRLFNEIGLRNPRFKGRNQQDSHELFRCLLDALIEEERAEMSDDEESDSEDGRKTFIEKVFEGHLCSTLTCETCHNESKVKEPFLDISLAMVSAGRPSAGSSARRSPSESPAEKKKKTGLGTSQNRSKQSKKKEKSKAAGKNKRGRVSEFEDGEEYPPASLVSSLEPAEGSEQQSEGGEVVTMFHTFDLSDENAKPSQELPDLNESEDTGEDSLLCSLFDDVDKSPASASENASLAASDDLDLYTSASKVYSTGSHFAPLVESLDAFLASEVLDGDNRPVCEECTRRACSEDSDSGTEQVFFRPKSDLDLDTALESSSECSDATVGQNKSLDGSRVTSEGEDVRDDEEEAATSATEEGEAEGSKRKKQEVRSRVSKRYSITSLPEVLTLQLNRFQQVQLCGNMRKLCGTCEFPLSLDMSKYVDSLSPAEYRLSGVVCHSGTLRSGHYVAYVNAGEEDDRWFFCSDATVRASTEDDVLNSEPYLLFYQRAL